jgi:hypothetical protein
MPDDDNAAAEFAAIREVIARLSFRVARTMPQIPHEYTVREEAADEADYIALHNAISANGVLEYWHGAGGWQRQPLGVRAKGKPHLYLYPGDGWRYWHMAKILDGPPGPDNRIINRNREDEAEQMRAQGLITSDGG